MPADCTFISAYGCLRGRWRNSLRRYQLLKPALECGKLRLLHYSFRSEQQRCWPLRRDWPGMQFRLVAQLREESSRCSRDVSGRKQGARAENRLRLAVGRKKAMFRRASEWSE